MGKLADLVRLARPRHWAKNAFVLLPVPFGLAAGGELQIASFVMGLLGFSLANSAAYAFNDAQDAEQDRAHPEKQRRPVAAGRIRPAVARAWSVLLLAAGFVLVGWTGNTTALVILVVYVLLNAVYSLIGKNVALIDVFILSTGFVLRVLLGCALIGVAPSNWLLLCSSALALFLSLAKRRADLARGLGREHRPSLAGYSVAFLEQAIGISAAMTLIAYGLYCMEGEVLVRGREFASLPFVLFGVLDYLRVALESDRAGNPVDLILSSPALLVCALGWAAAIAWSLGLL